MEASQAQTSWYARCRIPGPRSPVLEADHVGKGACVDEDTGIGTHTVVDIDTREIIRDVVAQTSTAWLGSEGLVGRRQKKRWSVDGCTKKEAEACRNGRAVVNSHTDCSQCT